MSVFAQDLIFSDILHPKSDASSLLLTIKLLHLETSHSCSKLTFTPTPHFNKQTLLAPTQQFNHTNHNPQLPSTLQQILPPKQPLGHPLYCPFHGPLNLKDARVSKKSTVVFACCISLLHCMCYYSLIFVFT